MLGNTNVRTPPEKGLGEEKKGGDSKNQQAGLPPQVSGQKKIKKRPHAVVFGWGPGLGHHRANPRQRPKPPTKGPGGGKRGRKKPRFEKGKKPRISPNKTERQTKRASKATRISAREGEQKATPTPEDQFTD